MKFFTALSLLLSYNTCTTISTASKENSYLYSFLHTTLQSQHIQNEQQIQPNQQRLRGTIEIPTVNDTIYTLNMIDSDTIAPSTAPISSPDYVVFNYDTLSKKAVSIEIPTVNETTYTFGIIHPKSIAPSTAPISSPDHVEYTYDPFSKKGPEYWNTILTTPTTYLEYITEDVNQCSSTSTTNKDAVTRSQSPINVKKDQMCPDSQAPNVHYGQTKFAEVDFLILPTGLRVSFAKKNTIPTPKIEISSRAVKLIHIDIKMKSEHYLNGKQYPGEFQMYFHLPQRGVVDVGGFQANVEDELIAMSILMDDSSDEDNIQLEQFIRQWEEESWKKQNECARIINPTLPEYAPYYYNVHTKKEVDSIWDLPVGDSTLRADFNIWRFMPTGYYCGYKGSLTEPPCTEKVTWRILDLPMKISTKQLTRMQQVLLNRLDEKCDINTAAYNGTVNRPLQPSSHASQPLVTQYNNIVMEDSITAIEEKGPSFCCGTENWSFRDSVDPTYWLESWPLDYHGWQGTTVKTYTTFFDFGGN